MQGSKATDILSYLRGHTEGMIVLLTQLVERESPSGDKPALDQLAAFVAGQIEALAVETRMPAADVEILSQESAGNHVRARWGHLADDERGGILLLCHMDTVWPVGTLAARPVRIEDGRLHGPGALDMKGGIVNALWAMRALADLGHFPQGRMTLLLNTDEETGSTTSRPIIEREAATHEVVFVLEPAQPPDGALKTSRKGGGAYRIEVEGRAVHAGVDHAKGINAIEELAHQILAMQQLTDYEVGTTVNVGVVGGGSRSNVVPDHAWARVDVRVRNEAEAERLAAKLDALEPRLDGARLTISGGIGRPPMVRTPAIAALYRHAAALAAQLGLNVPEASSGGGSDGNFTAALGIPTLDGMGPVGDGAHALHEHVTIASLPERAALLAAMIHSVDTDGLPAVADPPRHRAQAPSETDSD